MILGNEVSLAAYNKISKTEVKEPDNNTTNSLLTRKKETKNNSNISPAERVSVYLNSIRNVRQSMKENN
tara:strand:- start:6106 stop:6312 length:207 start_codon:yes stop_codon:yes gene_type:complete